MVAGAAARALLQAAAEDAVSPSAEETLTEAIDFVFVLFSAYLVFFMQSGFAMVRRRRRPPPPPARAPPRLPAPRPSRGVLS